MNKKWLILTLVIALGLVTFLVTAYSNGKAVTAEPSLSFVSHTEYWSGDHASTIVRLADYKGEPFANVQGCIANIYYPDKTPFVQKGEMQQSAIPGNWYRTDEAPVTEGTYEQEVICTYTINGAQKTTKASQSFHVNPALNFIRTVNTNVLAADAHLGTVDVTTKALVEDKAAALTTQINSAQTDLTGVLTDMNTDLTKKIADSNADINTNLTKVQVSVEATITSTGQTINAHTDLKTGELTDLITQVNSDLTKQLTDHDANIDADLSNVQIHVDGTIDGAKKEIISEITASNTNLNGALALAKSDLSTQIINTGNSLDTHMTNVQTTITTQMTGSEDRLTNKLTTMDGKLDDIIEAAGVAEMDYLKVYLPAIKTTVDTLDTRTTDIKTNVDWIKTHAMNDGDRAAIDTRFNTVDSDIDALQKMCGNELTSNSQLCQDIITLKGNMAAFRAENTVYYTKIDATTTNTYAYMTGDLSTRIDSILTTVGLIKADTTSIKGTVEAIRADQQNQVDIRIIS